MKTFTFSTPTTLKDAINTLSMDADLTDPDDLPRPLAGGQDLLTTMKEYITRPSRVVNLKTIQGLDGIASGAAALQIGALATLTSLEENPDVIKNFPGLAHAAHSIASPQIRNLGTVGGNLCQRPRCWYFRLEHVKCLKKGGSECYAATGENKFHAIFGGGPSYIVHPSDLAPMLLALDASLAISGPTGAKNIPIAEFFTLPAQGSIRRENILKNDELITAITVPASPLAKRSTYLKFKERPSLDFAMASVAAALELAPDKTVKQARIVLGGVAPIPWRVPKAETFLLGKTLDLDTIAQAAKIALQGAAPLSQNGYKIPLAQTLVRRALASLAAP